MQCRLSTRDHVVESLGVESYNQRTDPLGNAPSVTPLGNAPSVTPPSVTPPSGFKYDPENDGTPIAESLGVHEHWNNATDRKYSRNLGTGKGIELIYLSKP